MYGRLLALIENIRGSLWFWPVIQVIAAVLLARGTIFLDRSGWLNVEHSVWLFGSGTVGARTLLSTVATAMIAIAATVFSVTIVALSLAAGQLGPRLLRTFMRDRGTQASLGMFIATFAFCITVLAVVDASTGQQFVPRASVTAALALTFASLALLIYFIHHVAASIQAPRVIEIVAAELESSVSRAFATDDDTRAHRSLPDIAGPPSLVLARSSGYVQSIDHDGLVRIGRRADARIVVVRAPGEFAIAETVLAEVWPPGGLTPELTEQIQNAITCGSERTPHQDTLYLVKQLIEIAQRALSPGINDPTTAEACIDRLGSALGALLQRRMPSPLHADEEGDVRLVTPAIDFSSFVAAVFDPIRNCSSGNRQIMLRLATLLADLAPLVREVHQREPLLDQAERLTRATTTLPEPQDRAAVEVACRRAANALREAPGAGMRSTPTSAAGSRTAHAAMSFAALVLGCALALGAAAPIRAAEDATPGAGALPEVSTSTIAVNSDTASDRNIERRLMQLYQSVDGLNTVTVKVSAGVVELSGEVTARSAHEQAVALARRVESVVDVQDRLDDSTSVKRRLVPAVGQLVKKATGLIAWLPLLSVAAIVVLLFWWLAQLLAGSALFNRLFRRNPVLRDLARQVLRVAVSILGIVVALDILDASRLLTTLLGAAGVVGLALGFALRDTVENYIASLLLSLRQPFEHDDHVVIEGCEGRVLRLTPRATVLMTLDGNHTRIPNAKVYKAVILNYSRNPKRRFDFEVGVDTKQNLAEAQELAARTLLGMDGVLDAPAPYCTVEALGDSNVILKVFGWVDQQHAEFLHVRSEAIRLVKRAFDEADIVMPEPIYNLRMQPQVAEVAAAISGSSNSASASTGRDESANEPGRALDIRRKSDLDDQIAADRRGSGSEDLLSAKAARE